MVDRGRPTAQLQRRNHGYRHRLSTCSGCHGPINATSDPHGRGAPRPADLTMCVRCGTLHFFDKQLRLHPVTPEILESLPQRTLEELKEQQDRWMVAHGKSPKTILPARRPS
jgi:cytochrome c553